MDIFGGAPRVLGFPRPVVAQCGTDATLKCQIGGDPRPDVVWERKNVQILSEGRYKLSEEGKAYLLTISGVTLQDAGQYICKARNSIGETYAAASLKVEGEAQPQHEEQRQTEVNDLTSDDKPRFLIKPLSLRVDRGEDATFSCKLWGTPLPEVLWEKDGKKLNEIFESAHYSVSTQDGGWVQLKIFRTRMPDKGVYTCKAVNSHGEALAGAVLLVDQLSPKHRAGRHSLSKYTEEPPISASKVKKFAVAEGKHAKFRCFVTGKPKPEIIWKKDGVPLEPGRRHLIFEDREGYYTLKVLYSKVKDTGLYVCAASNALGHTLSAVHLSVKGPPVPFRRPLRDTEVRERDVAVLECEVPDETIPAAWYLEDQRLMPSSKYAMEQKGTKRRLTIHDVGTDDDGVYLCEMPDGGKSIAELSVKGTIVRKLPRKLEVLEGENAAFCVEVEDDDMEIHWFKDNLKLHETHQTIIKSFGKTHILVFVNVAYQDSGVVTFVAGRSKTSSRLKVKAARHSPPTCPAGVKMNVDRPNGALLTWVPAPSSPSTTRSIFVVERQELGSQEWQKCFTSESATSTEVTGDSVPYEGDYRFRVCCINKYGRSGHVEFPKIVHLVPGPKICRHLQGCEVSEGAEAHFSIELSASMTGTWFLNSTQLQDGGRYAIRQSQTQHSLVVREIRSADNAAEVTFIANGVRDSAVLKVKRRCQSSLSCYFQHYSVFTESGEPVVLYCEVSHPFAKVSWFKDGVELQATDGLNIQADGNMRRIVIQSAEASDSGVYTCETAGNVIKFNVEVAATPVTFDEIPEAERTRCPAAGEPVLLQCDLSHPDAHVYWYKDGEQIFNQPGIDLLEEGCRRTLIIQSADFSHSGVYSCQTADDVTAFQVAVTVMIVDPKDDVVMERYISEEIHLQCELSRSGGQVQWYKDGVEVEDGDGVQLTAEGPYRRLTIFCGAAEDSGEYVCNTEGDSVFFQLTVTEPPVRIISPEEAELELTHLASERLELSCEISQSDAPVRWYRDGLEVEEGPNLILEVDGAQRRLVIPISTVDDTGEYICDTEDDSVTFLVTVTGEAALQINQDTSQSAPVVLEVEVSRTSAEVKWWLDGREIEESSNITITEDGLIRRLTIHSPTPEDSGKYTCDATDDRIDVQVHISGETVELELSFSQHMVAGDDLILACEVSRANAPVQWYCNDRPLTSDSRTYIETYGTLRKIIISNIQPSDSGKYVSGASPSDYRTFTRPPLSLPFAVPRVVEFLTELHNTTVLEGEDATFKCVVSPEDVQLVWLMDNEVITLGDRFQATRNGLCHTLMIQKCQMLDCSKITAEAEGKISKASLKVQEAQVMFTRKMDAVMAEEFGDATMETEVSLETAEVQWMRQGVVIQPGPRHTLAQNGCKRTLTIHNLTLSDRGTYRCETLHDRTQVKLNVERKWPEMDRNTFERETASFEVELSHTEVEGIWQKDGIRVKPNSQWRVSTNGRVHGLTLSNLTLEDTGTIAFSAEGVRTTARLTVKGKSAGRTKGPSVTKTAFGNIFSMFQYLCPLKPGKNCRIYSMGRKRFCQILLCSLADSGTYTCDTGEISTSCSLEVYEHELEVVQDLEDLYIQEEQNAVFMCEVSLEDVTGEWYKDGHRIRPTSTIKIRTEGTKHFLLMCSVKAEDSGEIRFVAKEAESTAYLEVEELPVSIVKPLRDRTALEKHRVILECTVSSPRSSATWYKGGKELLPSDRVEILADGCCHKLVIQQVAVEDEGTYSVEVGEHTCKAKLMVEGKTGGELRV
uniref:Obscurin like cytoskeletal adaptor 1a n=1 Tax=Myripristis murdjan TaxID=586833 RepID=A0A667WA79_9TELE